MNDPPCTLTQVHGEPVSSVSTTYVKSVYGSGGTIPVSSLRPSQITPPTFTYGTDICNLSLVSMPGGMVSTVQPRATLP